MTDSFRGVIARTLTALLLFCILAVAHTWPLASAPATLSRNDNKDTVLNAWAIAWVAHALVTDPRHVLDGNIFHPERRTIAFSDPVIVPGALAVPIRAAGAGPVLTYNLLLLAGYALSAWAMQWLAWRWTGHYGASLVAGSLFAFNAHSLVSMGHIQAIHAYGLPLLLLGLDGLCRPDARRTWHGLLVGAATALLALTSGYLAIFGIVCGLVVVAARWPELSTPAVAALAHRQPRWCRADRGHRAAGAAGVSRDAPGARVQPFARPRRCDVGQRRRLRGHAGACP